MLMKLICDKIQIFLKIRLNIYKVLLKQIKTEIKKMCFQTKRVHFGKKLKQLVKLEGKILKH